MNDPLGKAKGLEEAHIKLNDLHVLLCSLYPTCSNCPSRIINTGKCMLCDMIISIGKIRSKIADD